MFGPVQAVEAFIFRAFNFTGRASRSEFWWAFLFQMLLYVGAVVVDVISVLSGPTVSTNPLAYMSTLVWLLLVIPQLSLAVRRLHDTGRSGLFYFVALIPLIGFILLLVMLALPSRPEDNKWGAPRRPGSGRSSMPATPDLADAVPAGGSAAPAGASAPRHGTPHKRNPYAGYAYLLNGEADPTPEMQARRRAEVADYYRARVLGTAATEQEA